MCRDKISRCGGSGHASHAMLAALGLAASAGLVHAGDIYRCIGANGAVTYTNIACPANSSVQHIASYQPEPDSPVPAYALPRDDADADARRARESEQARELGYRQAQADLALAAAQSEAVNADNAAYVPVYVPYARERGVHARHGEAGGSHHRRDAPVTPATTQRPSPNHLPLSSIPFYRGN